MSDLNNAIQLIRQGRKTEAEQILQAVIRNDPKNINAWFWYVETCATTEKRIQALEMCLKLNPGNPQVMDALQKFRGMRPMPSSAYSQPEEKPEQKVDRYAFDSVQPSAFESVQASPFFDEQEKPSALYTDEPYGSEAFRSEPEPVRTGASQKQPWEMQPAEYEDTSMLSRAKRPVRSYSTFDVWMTVLTSQDEKAYDDVLKDPEMGLARAFTWIALAGVISALAIPIQLILTPDLSEVLTMPEVQSTFGGPVNQPVLLLMITIAALLIVPLGGIINLAIFGGVQNFLAMFFGGGGNYTRTVYAIAAFLAPMTMITSLVAIVPLVGGCLSLPLAIYNLILNIRALKAAHALTNGAAIGVVLAPSLLVLMFICLFVFMTMTSVPTS